MIDEPKPRKEREYSHRVLKVRAFNRVEKLKETRDKLEELHEKRVATFQDKWNRLDAEINDAATDYAKFAVPESLENLPPHEA